MLPNFKKSPLLPIDLGLDSYFSFQPTRRIWTTHHFQCVFFVCSPRDSATWQVLALSYLFFLLGSGNILTLSLTVIGKIREQRGGYFHLRFTRLDKYFWIHKRRAGNPEFQRRYSAGAERIARRRSESGHSIETIMETIEAEELENKNRPTSPNTTTDDDKKVD